MMIMNARALNAYKNVATQTAIAEASPVELIVLVYARLIDNLRMAQKAMEEGKDTAEYVGKSLDLIQQGLAAALDPEKGGDIAVNLAALYDWSVREILKARIKNSPEMFSDVIEVFRNLESAWVEIHLMRSSAAASRASNTVHLSAQHSVPVT
jgi:flagellar protein FliS